MLLRGGGPARAAAPRSRPQFAPKQGQQRCRTHAPQQLAAAVPAAAGAAAAAAPVSCDSHQQQQQVQQVQQPDPNAALLQELEFGQRLGLLDSQGRVMLKNLNLKELEAFCAAIGEHPQRRAMQLWRWMYYDNAWVPSLRSTLGQQNGFSAAFCDKAEALATVDGGLLLEQCVTARDGTKKLAFKLTDGPAAGGRVETVLIPMFHRRGTRRHVTLCVSSQVGCAMNCQFCATGRMGLSGNLTTAQIVEQMVVACRMLAAEDDAGVVAAHRPAVSNVVFMGMGEPLDNLESVLRSIEIMTHPLGLHMSRQKVTVSTVGLVDRLEEFAASPLAPQLALSLHATTDEVRDWLVPVNRRHKLAGLTALLRRHYAAGNAAGRRVLLEYTTLAGINDSLEDASRLVELLDGVEAKVNLIRFNTFPGTRFRPSSTEAVLAFRSVLIRAGRVCTIRDSRGDDELAACGQLGRAPAGARPAPILAPPAWAEPHLAAPA